MSFRPIYEGWDIGGKLSRRIRRTFAGIGLNRDTKGAHDLAVTIERQIAAQDLNREDGRRVFASEIAWETAETVGIADPDHPLIAHWTDFLCGLADYEGWFDVSGTPVDAELTRSELWEAEDQLKRTETIIDHLDETSALLRQLLIILFKPLVDNQPALLATPESEGLSFTTNLLDTLPDPAAHVEHLLQVPFAPELDDLALTAQMRRRLEYNLNLASGGVPGDPTPTKAVKLPTKQSGLAPSKLIDAYLGGTPLQSLLDYPITITLPPETRFEHHHLVGGSGHGKTQTLQQLILHDLDAVAVGKASIVVIDSQSDLIKNIAGLSVFAPGGALHDRLVLIDPTDIEYPVALNLFDVGQDRLDQYSMLDRERLTNSILELYDFVLGTLLDAGMTQKQNVIFRYITRLLLHIPNATIHTLRELLEDGGYEKYKEHIAKLQGSAKAFFDTEFTGREFAATKRQVLRRLYGILENQTFERMMSHPQSKLDLFTEMNAGKVILINTAKDLLKENGTEIFGRFFIAMIAQAAHERATLAADKRLPTYVYIDEASDYFDQNIAIILSQARKQKIGILAAHQFLGQLSSNLHEAIAANTAIKFAGGVSAKDARALANDLRTDATFIERQPRLSFAAFIKGQTDRAVSIAIQPGLLEAEPRMRNEEWEQVRNSVRERYAVHYTQLSGTPDVTDDDAEGTDGTPDDPDAPPEDTGELMEWGE